MPTEQWQLVPTDLFVRRQEEFAKKRTKQLAAVLRNLARYKRTQGEDIQDCYQFLESL